MKKYVLTETLKYRIILLAEENDFDYYTPIYICLEFQYGSILLLKDNILFLKNIVERLSTGIEKLHESLEDNKLGLMLNEYYYNLYENRNSTNIILNPNGTWIGEKYCCFSTPKCATWIYKICEKVVIKVTPVFSHFEKDDYKRLYSDFIKNYKDIFKGFITKQQLVDIKEIVLSLFHKLD